MIITLSIIVLLLLVFLWLFIDFKLGRKRHLAAVTKREYPERMGELTLFNVGEELFTDLFDELRQATEHIHLLFYIVKDDPISQEFLSILMERAEKGVRVRLLVDWIGGNKMTKKSIKALKESGVQFYYCHKPKFPFIWYSINERNHRKIVVIDGKVGYVGGFNVGKEYLGRDPKFGFWRDYHLKVSGPAVHDLQTQFLYDFHDTTGEELLVNTKYFPELPEGSKKMKIVPTDGAFLQHHFTDLLNLAEDEIILGSPYFIPSKEVVEALKNASHRGVNVKILIPRIGDHPLVKEAAYPYFKPLMSNGIQFYFYERGFYHAKVFLIDDKICDIGTANIDKRSFFLNHEINCYIYDKPFIQYVKSEIRKDLADATLLTFDELKKRGLFHRGKEKVSTLVSNFL
ncbi:cardiolipin synthase [Bacillus sp. PS06]|uniref:cardiolipin synthase n=1 Tax=Bacillus sp. PS06 TaxID=2764176 RepID=UPI00177B31FA|nr:cardiolipin synthase [Bacillus sp. PS06]MBD8071376.1 cardiolipin synthase [Bacillus sp. PS06]